MEDGGAGMGQDNAGRKCQVQPKIVPPPPPPKFPRTKRLKNSSPSQGKIADLSEVMVAMAVVHHKDVALLDAFAERFIEMSPRLSMVATAMQTNILTNPS
eukprot:1686864-Amphidinium_carterae.1